MFERILFPTDFSEISERAADVIVQLKPAGVEEVTILNVIDSASLTAPAASTVGSVQVGAPAQDLQASSLEQGSALAARFEAAGIKATPLVRSGHPATVILDAAKELNSTVIVIGSTGKGRFAELILGSVSDQVVRSAHLPLLVIKPE